MANEDVRNFYFDKLGIEDPSNSSVMALFDEPPLSNDTSILADVKSDNINEAIEDLTELLPSADSSFGGALSDDIITQPEAQLSIGAQIVVLCCHLDSTADNESVYDKEVDPAPGVDDNCSGVCATLAIARYLAQYRGKLTHTVRFCFFNAEEEGLCGSQAYAFYLKNQNATIKAVINLDMMGFNKDEGRIFEIHAGYTDPVVRDLCLPIADTIKQWAAKLGKLGDGQIYKGTIQGGPEDYDRDKFDGAIKRSDHWSFQHHGYPGCHLSEDFFANLPTEPGRDANPNYHTFSDKVIDIAYSVDIASAATFALKEIASK